MILINLIETLEYEYGFVGCPTSSRDVVSLTNMFGMLNFGLIELIQWAKSEKFYQIKALRFRQALRET